jgi:hypothetical protein
MFKELDTVVIRSLRTAERRVDGTDAVRRQPRVGDLGTVVHVLGPEDYVVESVDTSGMTLWLADFGVDELASLPVGWRFSTEERSAGVYQASGVGPGGLHVEATDTDPSLALAVCREFALRQTGAG